MPRKGEPQTQWPFEEAAPAPAQRDEYQLQSERLDEEEKRKEAEEALPQMADASGGPMASYMREVKELRRQMADIPQLSKKREFGSQELMHLPQTPGRRSGTPRGSPRALRSPRAQIPSTSELEAVPESPSSQQNSPEDMQLAIIPEHGAQKAQTLVHVQVKPESQSRALVFPTFQGHAPKPLLRDDLDFQQKFPARPYWEDASEENKANAENTQKGLTLFSRRKVISWAGLLAMLLYTGSLAFYLWVRITKTLDLGPYLGYGVVVLIVECLGASTVILYGLNLLFISEVPESETALALEPKEAGLARDIKEPYHLRVCIPCYKEPLDLLQLTVTGALSATVPKNCRRTVYLCDDGKDPEKEKWVQGLGPWVQYVSGRKRPVGEMNGKSGNLNSCAAQLYPSGCLVPSSELICILDADQVPCEDFFLRTVPLFDGGKDVGMVLSPQCFHNLNSDSDVFNHANVHFWEYMQPGYDALGFISCTGTNFLMRANAFIDAGGSPTYTLTEDFALGMEMVKRQWRCRYVPSYLVVGEAPEQVRNAMQQRSRWVKGHFQIMFSWQHCPLLQSQLPLFMRIMYVSGVWSYIVGAISTPLFILVPIITIWFGIFPIIISWWLALALTIYTIAMYSVMYNIRKVQHIQALWFANCCNTNLWWVYTKAIYRAFWATFGGNVIKFKTTVKGSSLLANSSFRDLWIPILVLTVLTASIIGGIVKISQAYDFPTPLAISILWAGYQAVPPFLIIAYCLLTPTSLALSRVCLVAMLVSFMCGIAAVSLLWHSTYPDYAYAESASQSTFFTRAMQVGNLPFGFDVPWRSSALLQEQASGPAASDLSGGWLTGGLAGNLKMTMPTAFTTAMLAWGLLSFGSGYSQEPGLSLKVEQQVVWGADYLLKTVRPNGQGFDLIYQVGNDTVDRDYWGRPEDITSSRPYYAVPFNRAAYNTSAVDLGSSVAAALLAAYAAVPTAPNSATYLSTGLALYQAASASLAVNSSFVSYQYAQPATRFCGVGSSTASTCVGDASSLYNAVTYHDFVLWAAAWNYKATGNNSLLADTDALQQAYLQTEAVAGQQTATVNWGSVYYAANLLLAQNTDLSTYRLQAVSFMNQWMCNTKAGVDELRTTNKGRIWSYNDPSLGATANAAFMATAFAVLLKPLADPKARIYTCWAQQQVRYMLGDNGRSLVVGVGGKPPRFASIQSASCPTAPAICNAANSEFSQDPNPQTATGSLIYGNYLLADFVENSRADTSNLAAVEYNAGFQGALAGIAQLDLNWYQCKINYGITVADQTFCSKLKGAGG